MRGRSLHDKILLTINFIAVFIFILCGCFLDSECWKWLLGIMVLCYAWIGLFLIVNAERFSRGNKRR